MTLMVLLKLKWEVQSNPTNVDEIDERGSCSSCESCVLKVNLEICYVMTGVLAFIFDYICVAFKKGRGFCFLRSIVQ